MVQASRIADVGRSGVLVEAGAELTLLGCEVTGSGADGIAVEDGGLNAVRSRVRDGRGHGVRVGRQGRGALNACEVTGNAGDGVRVEGDRAVRVVECVVADNRGAGLRQAGPEADVRADGLDSHGNGEPDVWGAAAADPAHRTGGPQGALTKLDELVGLHAVKEQVATLVNLNRLAARRRAAGLPVPMTARHLVLPVILPNRLSTLTRYGLASKAATIENTKDPKRTALLTTVVRSLEAAAIDDALDLFRTADGHPADQPVEAGVGQGAAGDAAAAGECFTHLGPRLAGAGRAARRGRGGRADLDVAALWRAVEEQAAPRHQLTAALEQVE
jgi:hypothetical protein